MNAIETVESTEQKTTNAARVSPGVKIKIITVTPKLAEEMLNRNNLNRPMSENHVDELTRELAEGRWKFNGDTIREDKNGNILDSQHRLMACVRSGVSFSAILVSGLEPDVFDTIDAGKIRNASDVLALRGETNAGRLAPTLRFVSNVSLGAGNRKNKYTNTEIEAALASHPGVRDSVARVKDSDAKLLVPFPILAGCHYLFAQKDRELADRVIGQIISGTELAEDDPVHVFRERMLQLSLGKHRPSAVYIAALLIKAWNQVRAGEKHKGLSFRLGGKTPEKFPMAA